RIAPRSYVARQPATAPGTVIGIGPRSGIVPWSRATSAGSAATGARPLEFTHSISPSGRWTSAKRSPPTPHELGAVTAIAVAAASAASTAFLPRSKAAAPAAVASSLGVAIAHDGPDAELC